MRILFIGGCDRSGSTLLDLLLGQTAGFFSAGELCHIWERGLLRNELCGCGSPFRDCPVWSEVIRAASLASLGPPAVRDLIQLRRLVGRVRQVPFLLSDAMQSSQFRSAVGRYAFVQSRLYTAIKEVTGCSVIVDSSKDPLHGFMLRRIFGQDLRTIHLVRDARAVAFSEQRVIVRPEVHWERAFMGRHTARQVALSWVTANGLMHVLDAVHRQSSFVKYEDLTEHPAREVRRLLKEAGHPPESVWTIPEVLVGNHTVSGNPMRFGKGELVISTDRAWEVALDARSRRVVTELTWPLLITYGYPIQVSRS
jgi:hypothetical protein